jgi:hypothetical protein
MLLHPFCTALGFTYITNSISNPKRGLDEK